MSRFAVLIFIISSVLAIHAPAQQCGPGCPVCSGSGSSTGALLPSGTLIPAVLFIPEGEDETMVLNLRAGDDAQDAELKLQVMLTKGESVKGIAKEGMKGSYFERIVRLKVVE